MENISTENKDIVRSAFVYCESLLLGLDVFGEQPKEIRDPAISLGELMKDAILGVIEDYVQVCDEELYREDSDTSDEDYEIDDVKPAKIIIPVHDDYKFKVVKMHLEHPKWSLSTLKKKGAAVGDMRTLRKWEDQLDAGGSKAYKLERVDKETMDKFNSARSNLKPVTINDIRCWALNSARIHGLRDFKATSSWLTSFKLKHRISQRRVTRFVSSKEVLSAEQISERAQNFRTQFAAMVPRFDPKFVINTDQTGCQIQSTMNRTYSYKGEQRTNVCYKSVNKVTHSYTAQYTITLEPKLLKKVFLCMQEPTGKFGPIVKKQVEDLEIFYKNVVVTCSKSGKLSTELYKEYLRNILQPYAEDNEILLAIDSWSGQVNPEIYDEVFYNNENEPTCTVKVIPGKCTSTCQPLDVYFYRQVKILLKRIQNNSFLSDQNMEINSRHDNIKMHSLIGHQLSAPAFEPMIKYAWYACGIGDTQPEFQNVNQVCFPQDLQTNSCSCTKQVFIKCAFCRAYLCFDCFYINYHPTHCNEL